MSEFFSAVFYILSILFLIVSALIGIFVLASYTVQNLLLLIACLIASLLFAFHSKISEEEENKT